MVADEQTHRLALMCVLYDRRRQQPSRPGISYRQIESLMTTTSDEILFSIIYLKKRGLVLQDDKSNVQITVQGMEYLEQNLPGPELILPLLKQTAIAATATPLLELQSAVAHNATPVDPPKPVPVANSAPGPRRIVIPPRS